MIYNGFLYFITCAVSFLLAAALTPLVRWLALRTGSIDEPSTAIKTHKTATPLFGGVAIAAGFFVSLLAVRLLTAFPTGTLRSLRGFFAGALIMLVMGLIDDIKKPHGLGVKTKFIFQILAALVLVHYDMRIHFIQPDYLAVILSVLWVVGVSNAFNIIDIMDGFSSSQGAVAALGFLLIALPSEEIYVNFAAAALLGGTIGFLPYNMSDRRKVFLGDCGALFIGYVLAAISMGTHYSRYNPLGVYAPLLILAVPIYDTLFVSYMRLSRGQSPFMGSKDHYALRLEKIGFTRQQIVVYSAVVSFGLMLCAFSITRLPTWMSLCVYALDIAAFFAMSRRIARIKMQ
jgi:UDP-GlcNAc:undecaprenyl-phosphate GlcNAc-1-phosphate transferase